MDRPPLPHDMEAGCDLESPSSSMSALALSGVSPPPPRPVRPASQQLESSAPTTPRASSRRYGSTRKAIRRLSRLFHRVRNQFLAHIPPWSPIAPSLHADHEPPPASAPSILNDPVDDAFDGHLSLDSVEKHNDDLTHSVLEDYQPDKATNSDHISVQKNERVELLDRFAAPDAEYVAVAVIDPDTKQPSTRRGIIPSRLLSGFPVASASASSVLNGNTVGPSSSTEDSRAMSKLMKRSRTVDTSSATTSPSHTARSTASSGIDHLMLPPGASIIVPPDSDVPIANSSSKKQRWSFAFRKRWFSSSSSRSGGRTMSQSEDLESPTNISGVALTFPQRTTLGPPTEEGGDASCSAPDRPQIDPHGASASPATASTSAEKKRTSLRRFFNNSSSRESQPSSKSVARESPQSNASRQSVPDIHQQGQSSESPQDIPDDTTITASGSDEPVPSNSNTTTNNMSTSAVSHQPMDEPGVAEDPSVASSPTEPDADTPKTNGAVTRTPAEEARYKRQFVIQELVDTERDYVTDLELIVDGYMKILGEQDLPEDLQGKDKIIFANIAQILEFHQTCFLKEIEKCLENYQAAGLAFVKYERRLHTYYVKYCQNKPKSDFLMAQEQFEQFFNETRLKLGQKRTLTDLLIKPVQRIQKYQLLMRDILKYTERAGDSMDALRKGFDVMCIVPKACDDMMQVGRLQNFDGNLNAQGKLLYQGLLQISESSPSQPFKGKERIVFLFEQSAIIADSIPKRTEFSSPTYIFKNQIMVNKMVLENNVADEPLRFVLRSNDPNQPLAFLCQANTIEEKQQWLEKINAQLDQQKTLLAALVDPKRYQNQLANNFSALSLQNNKKDSSSSLGCPTSTSPNSALNSPKNATPPGTTTSKGSKLFGFGKKSSMSIKSQGPTSPH